MRIVLMHGLTWTLAISAALCSAASPTAPSLGYHVVATHPHDPTAFTEGLVIDHGRLFESTGRNGDSMVTIRDLATMRLLKTQKLDDRDFGEGLAIVGKQIVQLTWKGGVGYLYDFDLHRTGSFQIMSEGWGLTYDGRQLIRSDGSSTLQMLDPKTFKETRHVRVHDGVEQILQINELEFVNGRIYANVWMTDRIAVIEPGDGHVIAWLDLSSL